MAENFETDAAPAKANNNTSDRLHQEAFSSFGRLSTPGDSSQPKADLAKKGEPTQNGEPILPAVSFYDSTAPGFTKESEDIPPQSNGDASNNGPSDANGHLTHEEGKLRSATQPNANSNTDASFDGNKVEDLPDGTQRVSTSDGRTQTFRQDGTVTTSVPEGDVVTVKPSGTVDVQEANGVHLVVNPDGSRTVTDQNGTVNSIPAEQPTTYSNPDGSTDTNYPPSSSFRNKSVTKSADGSTSSIQEDWDGTTTETSQSAGQPAQSRTYPTPIARPEAPAD